MTQRDRKTERERKREREERESEKSMKEEHERTAKQFLRVKRGNRKQETGVFIRLFLERT